MHPNRTKASIRPPAVAGLFYPDDPGELRDTVSSLLGHSGAAPTYERRAFAFIVPHAGYLYSGSIAASAYRALAHDTHVRRIVLIGPSHRVYFQGVALPSALAFKTPLGEIPIDDELTRQLADIPHVAVSDEAHQVEHSLEVQLPFLQMIFGAFTLLPLVAGEASATDIAAVLTAIAYGEDTVLLVSSDLSHYLPYDRAQQVDAQTSQAILRREPTLTGHQACGAVPINGLLHLARACDARVEELARCNSGDTGGDRQRVVGYGAYAVYVT